MQPPHSSKMKICSQPIQLIIVGFQWFLRQRFQVCYWCEGLKWISHWFMLPGHMLMILNVPSNLSPTRDITAVITRIPARIMNIEFPPLCMFYWLKLNFLDEILWFRRIRVFFSYWYTIQKNQGKLIISYYIFILSNVRVKMSFVMVLQHCGIQKTSLTSFSCFFILSS